MLPRGYTSSYGQQRGFSGGRQQSYNSNYNQPREYREPSFQADQGPNREFRGERRDFNNYPRGGPPTRDKRRGPGIPTNMMPVNRPRSPARYPPRRTSPERVEGNTVYNPAVRSSGYSGYAAPPHRREPMRTTSYQESYSAPNYNVASKPRAPLRPRARAPERRFPPKEHRPPKRPLTHSNRDDRPRKRPRKVAPPERQRDRPSKRTSRDRVKERSRKREIKDRKKNEPKTIKHDFSLRQVIFASGNPEKDEEIEFLTSKFNKHPGTTAKPSLRLGENGFYFLIDFAESEKSRRRGYDSRNRGLCKWEIYKRDIESIRSFEGNLEHVVDPGPQTFVEEVKAPEPAEEPKKQEDENQPEIVALPLDEIDEATEDSNEKNVNAEMTETEKPTPAAETEETEKMEVENEDKAVEVEVIVEEVDDLGTPTPEELNSRTVKELKSLCGDRNLEKKGLKAELVQRLHNYLSEKGSRIVEQKKASAAPEQTEAVEEESDAIIEVEGKGKKVEMEVEQSEAVELKQEVQKAEVQVSEQGDVSVCAQQVAIENVDVVIDENEEIEEEETKEGCMVLPVYELTSVPEELRDVCWAINQVLNIRPKVDIFVPDLSRVSAWAQDEQALCHYLEVIPKPSCFEQVHASIMEGSLNTEDEVLESVKLIFNNARTYNEDDSEWFINANHLEAEFNKIFKEKKDEANLVEVDEEGNVKFDVLEEPILHHVIESAGFEHTGIVEKNELVKLAEDAAETLKSTDKNVRNVIIEFIKKPKEDPKENTEEKEETKEEKVPEVKLDPMEEGHSFFVVVVLNHMLRKIRFDSDLMSRSKAEKSRILILEFLREGEKEPRGVVSKVMTEGSLRGVEKKNIWETKDFSETVRKMLAESEACLAKETKAATLEELQKSSKKMENEIESLSKKLKGSDDQNKKLKGLLKQISGLIRTEV